MTVVICSRSIALKRYISQAIDIPLRHKEKLSLFSYDKKAMVLLIHIKSYTSDAIASFLSDYSDIVSRVAILDDFPSVHNMLLYTQIGVKGYCNSYMAAAHYQQMLELLSTGQSWFPPQLLEDVFALAGQYIQTENNDAQFKLLTPREKQVAYKVAEGSSNKIIARDLDISERTVKSHLSHIFKKLQLKDRMALVLYIKHQVLTKTGT